MFVARLVFNATAERKLAQRGIRLSDVRSVAANGPYLSSNPHPRVPGSRFMIGPDAGGRILTVVLQPDSQDDGTWHVMTAWSATQSQMDAWRRWGKGG